MTFSYRRAKVFKSFRFVLALGVLGWVGVGLSAAQVLRSSIAGRVSDPSGAAIPDAQITVTNQQTGVPAHTKTDSTGNYMVPELDPGVYSIKSEKQGFSTETVTGLQVLAQETVRSDLKMRVGSVSDNVQVSAVAPLINTENGTIQTPITTTQLKELPTPIQDIDSFLILAAGVGRATFNSAPQIAGSTHWGADNFTLNGVSVNDSGNGGGSYSFGLGGVNLPSLSSLQEVTVGGIGMDARYSRIVNVQMVTKAGTNRFHGDAYWYLENTVLNANTFVNNAAGVHRPPFHRNEFGGDIGGPILKNRAFAFFDYDALRQNLPVVVQNNLPTAAQKQGNFGTLCGSYNATGVCNATGGVQLYNPQTGKPFANNVIPSSMITSQAQSLMAFLPNPTDPNSPGLPQGTKMANGQAEQYNYTTTVGQVFDVAKWDLRLDYHLSDHDSLFGVYSHSVGLPWFDPLGTPPTFGNGQNYGYKTYTLSGTETHIFGVNTTNSLRGAWFEHESIRSGQNSGFNPYSIFTNLTPSNNRGLPTMTTTGYTSITDIGQNDYTHQYDIEITDDFTHVRGRHTLQAGVDETGFKIYNPSGGYGPLGTFTFNGTWTGNGGWPGQPTSIGNTFADFLLGDATSATTGSATPDQNVYSRDWEFYGQDVWQVAPSLTVNYGLRYVYQSPWVTKGNIATFFSFDQNKLVLAQDSGTPTPPPGTNPAQLTAYPFTTTQALGLPITFYQPDRNNFGPRVGFAWRLTQNNDTVLRGGYGIYYNFNAAYIGFSHNIQNPPWGGSVVYSSAKPSKPTAPFLPDITFNAPFPTSQAGAPAAHPTVYAMNSNFQNARIQQFNLTGEHQFRDNWKMRMSYVGNRTINLPITQYNTNIPAVQQPTQPLQNARPYQPWGPIQTTNNENISNTDQMQVEGLHQFSQGFLAQAQYEWTNCRDIAHPTGAGPAVVNQPRLDYGNCPYLARHTFVANYVFDLPFGRDRHWLKQGWLSQVAGGWSFSGVTTYETGPPFSVTFVPPSTYPGWIAGRANVIPGASVYTYNHAHSPTAQWLNPAAFVSPAPGQVGNSPRDGFWGPGYWNYDMSVLKNFYIHEAQTLSFRADFLNAFNHTNWDGGGTSIGGVAAPVVANVSETQYGGAAVNNFGNVTTGEGSRIIQVSLRYTF
jgi:hypothetical protein